MKGVQGTSTGFTHIIAQSGSREHTLRALLVLFLRFDGDFERISMTFDVDAVASKAGSGKPFTS